MANFQHIRHWPMTIHNTTNTTQVHIQSYITLAINSEKLKLTEWPLFSQISYPMGELWSHNKKSERALYFKQNRIV